MRDRMSGTKNPENEQSTPFKGDIYDHKRPLSEKKRVESRTHSSHTQTQTQARAKGKRNR